ncbi:hypothetical protein EDM59_23510 [Brevibacillus nitrificans]|uniref:TolC family protein n=1 Tax=Brevibacillus nitrificans TaxID=651560 RepID=A0A3M8CWW2_9BACL|nr:TolC family protein [Brevibacillus nitrificans]RNB80322.1 hypothetical protein EDM59_23510 [Brevibacillus nitrificans]
MKKKKKQLVFSLAFFPLLFAGISAVSTGYAYATEEQAVAEAELLTMEKAIMYVQHANQEVATAKLDAENAGINGRLTLGQLRGIPAEEIDSLQLAQQKYVTKAQSEMNTRITSIYAQALDADVRYRAILSYYDLLNAYKAREWKKHRFQRTLELVQSASASTGPKRLASDRLQAEVRANGAQAELAFAQLNWEAEKIKQNEFLGVAADKEWRFSEEEGVAPELPVKIEDAIESTKIHKFAVQQRKEEMQIAQLGVSMISQYSALSTFPGKMARNNLEKAEIALETTVRSALFELYAAFQRYEDGKQLVQVSRKGMDLATNYYEEKVKQYRQGGISLNEALQAEQDLADQETLYVAAIHDFNKNYAKFQ